MGVEMTPKVRAWDNDQRRVGSLVVLGLAAVIVVAALVTWFLAGNVAWLYWTLVVLLVVLLVAEGAMFVLKPAAAAAPEAHGEPHVAYGPSGPAAEPQPAGAKMLTLRCGDCSTVFEVTDTGERPLHHVCPGCGAEGILKGESAPPPMAPVVAPEPAPAPADAATPTPAPAAPTPRRLKLRCGGCKEVFTIEDTGERPLRRACPHCSRMGEIR